MSSIKDIIKQQRQMRNKNKKRQLPRIKNLPMPAEFQKVLGITKIHKPHIPVEGQFFDYNENQNINPDHIYLNLLVNNNLLTPIPLQFTETRSQAILRKPNDYVCSVVRFYISSNNLIPLFLFRPLPGLHVNQWNIATIYNLNQYIYWKGFNYQSLISNNIGNQPDISPAQWVLSPLVPNQNIGQYTITLTYANVDYQEPVIYTPDDNTSLFQPPYDWTILNQNNVNYYSIFFINQFVDEVNQAFLSAYNRVPGAAPPKVAGAPAPFIMYDSTTNLLSLVAHRTFDQKFAGAPTIQIWMNTYLYQKFSSIPISLIGGPLPVVNGKNFLLHVYEKSNNIATIPPPDTLPAPWQQRYNYVVGDLVSFLNVSYQALNPNVDEQPNIFPADWGVVTTFTPPMTWVNTTVYAPGSIVLYFGNYYLKTGAGGAGTVPTDTTNWTPYIGFDMYRMDTEYQQIYKWFDLTSIVFISSLLPVVEEYVPSNGDLGNTTTNTSNTSLGIITDFQFELNGPNDPRQNILYTPTAEYRLINLVSDTPLTSINIAAFWTDRNNQYYKIFLNLTGQATIKLLFRKRKVITKEY
jgi:hypothetical protein